MLFAGSKKEMERSEERFLEGCATLEEHGVERDKDDCRKRKRNKSKCPA